MTSRPPNRVPQLVDINTGDRHPLDAPSNVIGRAPDSKVVLQSDEFASGRHARIYFQDGAWWLEDLKSSNGTTVNDQFVVAPLKLSPKDVIKVGHTLFRIE